MTLDLEKKLITVEVLAKLPPDMGYELQEGELIPMSPAGIKHGIVAALVIHYFLAFVLQHASGQITTSETGFVIRRNPDTVRGPDMAFIPKARMLEVTDGFGEVVPALVVEVISPHDTAAAVEDKTQLWLNFGVTEVWNVYPNGRRVLVHRKDHPVRLYQNEDAISGGDILPNFVLALNDIFRV